MTYYIWNPGGFPNIMSALGAGALIIPTLLLGITVVIIILLVLAVWRKALLARAILIPLVLLLSFLTVEPIIKMLNYAKNENVSVSLSSHFLVRQKSHQNSHRTSYTKQHLMAWN
ncbi:hypothetical protein AAHB47_29515 [Bacillus wiedmannii]